MQVFIKNTFTLKPRFWTSFKNVFIWPGYNSSVVEYMPSMCKALGLITITRRKKLLVIPYTFNVDGFGIQKPKLFVLQLCHKVLKCTRVSYAICYHLLQMVLRIQIMGWYFFTLLLMPSFLFLLPNWSFFLGLRNKFSFQNNFI